jgi:23S rRNA (uracil1939-C5)-methyltransferase
VTEARIEDLSTDGRGVVRIENIVYFVSRALPGDLVSLDLNSQTNPASARVVALLEPSPFRVAHPCPYADICQGSLWGGFDYGKQLESKHSLAVRTLRKAIGDVSVLPTVASPRIWNYRNRIRLNVWREDGQLRVGYRTEARQLTGVPIHTCFLPAETIANCLRALLSRIGNETAASDPQRIQIHETAAGAGMLLFSGHHSQSSIREWTDQLASIAPGGLWFANATKAGVIVNSRSISHSVNALPMRTMWLGHTVEVHPAAFCQANSAAANLVGERLARFRKENDYANVWDLYGGFGALGLAAAHTQSAVTVFELSRLSEPTMQSLARDTNVSRTDFIAGDLLKTLPSYVSRIAAQDLIILDPPRSGAHPDILKLISRSKSRLLIYLSCNPARLARDLRILAEGGFQPVEVQPYDFFPQTPATEVLAILSR